MASTFEDYLENQFVKWCAEQGIIAPKGPAGLLKGFPDRLVILPRGGGTIYVEFKGTSKYYDLSPMQKKWQRDLRDSDPARYFKVETLEELEQLKAFCLSMMLPL